MTSSCPCPTPVSRLFVWDCYLKSDILLLQRRSAGLQPLLAFGCPGMYYLHARHHHIIADLPVFLRGRAETPGLLIGPQNSLLCFDPRTGLQRWAAPFEAPLVAAFPGGSATNMLPGGSVLACF